MKKRMKAYIALCAILILIIVSIIIIAKVNGFQADDDSYSDGIEQIDPNTIILKNSNVKVSFSDVILSKQNETRMLKVSEQEATVSCTLSDQLINGIDWGFMKKTQDVTYSGTGSFVVDLNTIDKASVIDDTDHHILTIKIDHARLDTIEINPDNIIVDDVNIALLNWGNINMTINDYKNLETEIRARLEAEFNTPSNAQQADDIAKKMVKDTYEPIVKAIDDRYEVIVEFK